MQWTESGHLVYRKRMDSCGRLFARRAVSALTSTLHFFAELLPHGTKRAIQQFMLGQVLRQYRATVGYVSVVDDEIHALAVCRHGIRRGQVRRTEDHELVTASIERTLTQEGQHEIRL